MRKLTVLILFLAGLAMAGAVMLVGVMAPPAAPPVPGAEQPVEPGSLVAAGVGSSVVADHAPADKRARMPRREVERGDEIPVAAGEGPWVLVVDKQTRAPVAGAEVSYCDYRDVRTRKEAREANILQSELAERFGKVLMTGTDGRVQLPAVRSRTLISADHAGGFAWTSLRQGEDFALLELERDETLVVEVIGSRGSAPAGIPVAVYRGEGADGNVVWSGETNDEGQLFVRHFQLIRQRKVRGNRYAAALRIPFRVPAAVGFRVDPLPTEPVTIRLPETGSLQVDLVDAQGRPVRVAGRLRLRTLQTEALPTLPLGNGPDSLTAEKQHGETSFEFPFVGLGLEFEPTGIVGSRWKGETVRGPTAPDEMVRATVTLPTDITLLTASLESPEGDAMSQVRLDCRIDGAEGRVARDIVTLDENGGFGVAVRLAAASAPFSLLLVTRDEQQRGTGIHVNLTDIRIGQSNDLGTLRLDALDVIARGSVVDDRGYPAVDARVFLQVFEARNSGRSSRMAGSGGSTRVSLGAGRDNEGTAQARWLANFILRTSTDQQGRFELLGTPPSRPLRLLVQKAGYLRAVSSEITVGDEVQLRLTRAGTLDGDIGVPHWLQSGAVRPHLRSRLDAELVRTGRLQVTDGKGRFWFRALAAGVYDLSFEIRGFDRPLLVVPNLPIVAGENGDHPQLQGLDLTPFLHRVRLRGLGNDGSQPDGGRVTARAPGSEPGQGAPYRMKSGTADIVTPEPVVEITVLARGYLPVTLTARAGERDVYLEPAPRVTLRLTGLQGLAGRGRVVTVTLEPEGGEETAETGPTEAGRASALLGDYDTVTLPLVAEGPYRVSFRIQERGARPLDLGPVDVRFGTSAPILVPFDPARVAAELGGGR